jgi:hypothetical protein
MVLDIVVAVATSSAIGTWVLWREGFGEVVWASITGFAALVAVAKPFLHLPREIERLTCLYTGHGAAFHDLQRLVERVARDCDYSDETAAAYTQVTDRMRELCPQDDPSPNLDLLDRFFAEVNHQIPPRTLWWP